MDVVINVPTIFMQTCSFQDTPGQIGLDIITISKWQTSEYIYVFVCKNAIVSYDI